MRIRNRIATVDMENHQTAMTPEEVACMPIQDIKERLWELGLDPNEPLPDRLKQLISQESEEDLEPIITKEEEFAMAHHSVASVSIT
jgi:hypothetical protein